MESKQTKTAMPRQGLGITLLTRSLAISLGLAASSSLAQDTKATDVEQLLDLSLEELLDVKVTSVSRREERLFNAAAAVYVITDDDIR